MQFYSAIFLGSFFPIILLLYFSVDNRIWRNIILLLASICFYAWGQFIFVIGMIVLSTIDYIAGRLIWIHADKAPKAAKILLIIAILLNFGVFAVFIYLAYRVFNVSKLNMPIGMIIFMFQSVSYIVDIYRGKAPVQKNYFYLLLYISFFPNTFVGPIIKYSDVYEQIEIRKERFSGFSKGSFRFLIGLVKIGLLANCAGNTAIILLGDNLLTLSAAGAWIGIFLFSCYVYFYFSGYSDIAIGLAQVFGFHYKENFNYPYTARGIWDYWYRWNISLSSFFNEYIWEPMNKKWNFSYVNSAIIFLFTGLWYGVGVNFLLWGVYFLILLIIEWKLSSIDVNLEHIPLIRNIITTTAVVFGWGIFYYKNLHDYSLFLEALFGLNNRSISLTIAEVTAIHKIFWMIPVFIIACTPFFAKIGQRFFQKGRRLVYRVQFLCLFIVCVFSTGLLVNALVEIKGTMLDFSINSWITGTYASKVEKMITTSVLEKEQPAFVIDYCKKLISNYDIVKRAEDMERKNQAQVVKDNNIEEINKTNQAVNSNIPKEEKKGTDKKYQNTGQYIILEDKAIQLFHYNKDSFNYSLETYNKIMNSLPKGINKYLLISPMRICFEDEEYKRCSDNLKSAIDGIYNNISKDVTTVDAYKYLKAHKDERIFLNTDYYWTALGAYYAAQAFCNTSGIKMRSIEDYEVRSFKGYIGAFSYIKEAKGLIKYPENVDYYLHKDVSNTQLVYKYDKNKSLITYESPAIALSRRGYNIFIGTNISLSVIKGDKKNNKVLMIMGDAYAKAFAPWLIPYYEKVIVINPIYFKGREPEFQQLLKNFKVTDFIILEYGNDISSRIHSEELRKTCIYKK